MYVRFMPIGYGGDQQKPHRSRFAVIQSESVAMTPALVAAVKNIKNAVCIDTILDHVGINAIPT